MILTADEEQALDRMAELIARAEKEAILDEYEKLRDKVLPGILQVVQKAVAGGMICLVIEKTSGRKKTINRDSLPCITATDVSLIDGEIRIFAKPWEPEVSEYARELEAQAHAFNRAEGVRKAKITRAKNKAAKAQKEGKQY